VILQNNADMAMYQAKSQGSNQFVFYESSMNDKIMQRLHLENALLYQPTVNLQTMQAAGVEALSCRPCFIVIDIKFPDFSRQGVPSPA